MSPFDSPDVRPRTVRRCYSARACKVSARKRRPLKQRMKKVPVSVKYSKCARVFKGASVASSSILPDKRTLSPGRKVCLSITARPSLLVPAFQQRHNQLWPGSNRAAASGTTPDRVIAERRVKSGNAFERTPRPNPLRPSPSFARTTWSLHLAPLHRPGDTRRSSCCFRPSDYDLEDRAFLKRRHIHVAAL